MYRGGRGNRGGPAAQNFNGNSRGFVPRGGRGGRGRGRGGRGRGGGGGGGGGGDDFGGMNALRRQDLADEIMSQVEDLEEEEEFNFGISFKTLGGGGGPSRDSSGRGRGRGRGRGGSQQNSNTSNTRTYAYQDDTLIGAGRGATTRQRGSGLGFGSPNGKIVVAGGSGVRAIAIGSKDPWSLPDYGRPLLRPVVFVRATLQKTLFEEVDEVIQAHDIVLEDVESDNTANGAQNPHHHPHDPALSHAPTADRVAAVFGIAESEPVTTTTDEEADESNAPATPKATQILAPADSDGITVQLETKLRISDAFPSPATDEQSAPLSQGAEVTNADKMEITSVITAAPTATEPAINAGSTPSSTPDASRAGSSGEPAFIIDTTPSTIVQESTLIYNSVQAAPLGQVAPSTSDNSTIAQTSEEVSFVIDTTPSTTQTQEQILTHSTSHLAPLGHTAVPTLPDDDDEEIIVYDPLQRSKPATPAPPATPTPSATPAPVSVDDVSFARLSTRSAQPATPESTGRTGLGRLQQLKERVTARRAGKKRRQSFGMLGALLEETRVQAEARERAKHEAAYGKGKGKGKARDHPVYGRGREGDSDLEWGTESEGEDDGVQADVSALVHPDDSLASMDVDPDLVDSPAFARFAQGLRAPVHQTLDDFEDAEKLAREDEDDEERSSDEEEGVDVPVSGEESDEVSEDDSEDESFDARLQKIRAREKKAEAAADAEESDEDDDEDEDTKADNDERYLANVHRMLEAEARDKGKGKKHQTFDAVLNGSFDYEEEENYFPERIKRKNKGKTFVDPALAAQWERDRQKKAEQKREREEARALATAAALSPRHAKQLAKRFTKDNHYQGFATGAPIALEGGKADFVVLEAEIRAFVGDLRRDTLVLPPLDKPSRARVHIIAQNFGLKSKSTGKGDGRYITLSRTSRTRETAQNENKVRRLVYGGALKGGRGAPRHRDGDEVGKAAPKLTDTNLGYRLLQQMGWAEGDRIGLSTRGLEAPISAFIKTTKLGLGATR